MAALANPLDEIYKEIMSVRNAFAEFDFCYNNGGNVNTFNFLATQYGKLDRAVKRLSTAFKKHKAQPEIAEYSQLAFDHLLSYNIYEAMKYDFEIAKPIFDARLHLDMERWPDFKDWDPVEVDWETVNTRFKKAI